MSYIQLIYGLYMDYLKIWCGLGANKVQIWRKCGCTTKHPTTQQF